MTIVIWLSLAIWLIRAQHLSDTGRINAGIAQMLDLARSAKDNQMTIVMSSHQLNQVERICSRVGIMVKGKLIQEGSLAQLGRKAGGSE